MRRFRWTLTVHMVLIGAVSGGCRQPSQAPRGPVEVVGSQRVPIARFGNARVPFTNRSGFSAARRYVVRDETAWRETWATLHRGWSPAVPPPDVDFTREMVVVIALGERPSTGYGIVIDSAVASASQLIVWGHAVVLPSGCVGVDMLTQPVDLARLPRVDAPVEFRDGPQVASCRQ